MGIIGGCSSPRTETAQNLAYKYRDDATGLRPSVSVYHPSVDSSWIRLVLDRSDLLYKTEAVGADFRALIEIEYRLLNQVNGVLVDSGTLKFRDYKSGVDGGKLLFEWGLLRPTAEGAGGEYTLDMVVRDPQRGSEAKVAARLDGADAQNRQYFRLRDVSGQTWIETPWVRPRAAYTLECGRCPDRLFVRYFGTEYPLATPPFASNESGSFDFSGDSVGLVRLSDTLTFDRPGLYHFQVDSAGLSGFTAFALGPDYPRLSLRTELAPPLRYLTTKKEYETLAQSGNPDSIKREVDRFWLKIGGSPERARTLIEAFYRRVEEANERFTSYTPGWRTDRGILYVVYGPPDEVLDLGDRERWYYGNRQSALSYAFEFVRVENPFTDQDYSLVRLADHRYGWQQAIAGWRSGKVYGSADIKREQDARDAQLRIQRQSPGFWY